jgi:23S rRNA (guanosine2251-2'-O)-methyltransferase
MSQKETDFQSKPRRGGQKFGGRDEGGRGGGGRAGGRSEGRKFGERNEGDKPRSFDRDARPPRRDRDGAAGGNPYKKRESSGGEGRRDFGDKPRRSFGDRDSRPPRDRSFGDKPYKKREFGGAGGGEGRKDFGDKPRRSFGDRDSRPPRGDRPFGDKPYKKREFGGAGGGEGRKDFGDKPRRSFGDRDSRPPRGDRPFGDKPFKKREFDGDRPRRDFEDKPRKSFGDRDFGDKPRRSFGDRDEGRKSFGGEGRKEFGDKPRKDFGEKKLFDKFSGRPQKSFERYDEERPAKKDFGAKLKSDRPSYGAPSSAYLYGIHAVSQALLNPKRVHQRLLCTEKGYAALSEAWADAQSNNISLPEVTYVEKEDLERLLPRDAVHQDVLLDSQPLEDLFLADIIADAAENAVILVLDQVTDPHNVGAILRSAAAFGALAVVMQKLHAPETTGTLAKAASGAVEHVPIVREVNLSRSLEQLKEAGFFCIGLAEEGKQTLAKMNLTGKTALVLGAEGSGLRRLVSENCDDLVKLPTQDPIGSLNVSNAAAVALYELVRAR